MLAEHIVAFLTLTALEIVLGIDNVIFIAILSGKLPREEQAKARQLGIAVAVVSRLILLLTITLIIDALANTTLFTLFSNALTGRDLILLIGGMFLIGKSTYEIHEKLEGLEHGHAADTKAVTLSSVLFQILLVDVVFSLDSVITAIGISENLWVMVPAIVIAAAVMLLFSNAIASFVEKHPTFKILALAFLILIGSILVIEGWNSELAHQLHIKNYVYFAMAFSFIVELINLRFRKSSDEPVKLHQTKVSGD
jgi:predicted tellurium resistance membrane protein TerC